MCVYCAKKIANLWKYVKRQYYDDYVKKMNDDIILNKIFGYKYFKYWIMNYEYKIKKYLKYLILQRIFNLLKIT